MDFEEEVTDLRFPFHWGRKSTFSFEISPSDFSRLERISKVKGWTVDESLKQCLISSLREKESGHDTDSSKKASSGKVSMKEQDDLRKKYAILSIQEKQLRGTSGGLQKIYEEQFYNNTLIVLSLTGNKATIRDYHKLLEIEGNGELDEEDRYFMDKYLSMQS